MSVIKLFFDELNLYGFKSAFGRVLKSLGFISEAKLYEIKVENYYRKLDKSQYKDELLKWLKMLGISCDIDNPKTFNEKIHYLKLNDNTKLKEQLSDKYAVREWISEKIGDEYLVPLVGVWERAEDIDFDKLPSAFCLKANHGSNMNLIVKDKSKLDVNAAKKTADEWMHCNFGWEGFELQYVNIPRKIIAEKYIEQMDGNLLDYKVHCFHGVPRLIHVIGDRNPKMHTGKEAFYDTDWTRNDLMYHTYDQYENDIPKPGCYDEMIKIATTLSEGFKYVRVDLYEIDGKIMFGEMTFTPTNGIGLWESMENNLEVGSWI